MRWCFIETEQGLLYFKTFHENRTILSRRVKLIEVLFCALVKGHRYFFDYFEILPVLGIDQPLNVIAVTKHLFCIVIYDSKSHFEPNLI
jgi:hypothetical protein